MNQQLPPDAAAALAALAEVVYVSPDYEGVYAAICKTAVQVIPNCDHASISTLTAGGTLTPHGATDRYAEQIDGFESALRDGPCYDAIVTDSYQVDADLTVNPTWPELSRLVLAHTPVRGMIGYRVLVGPRKAGSLNLFSDTPGGFAGASADLGVVLASFASVALSAAAQNHRADTLLNGLHSNREIGKAIGLLMATHDLSEDAALDLLKRASQDLNRKLVDVAREVVDRHPNGG
ncbi:GAF and ANTAR domain-containing protein [Nocardioides houyundeii]|uniref:GAF and ANTAR domain-containing protein n=1 Tax=Nocardioides houyundeii TaxID=2045452 RepID=UPI001966A8D3|nr:GAF and ANTAR domain-containing protein [Nocardioides houyundeii]